MLRLLVMLSVSLLGGPIAIIALIAIFALVLGIMAFIVAVGIVLIGTLIAGLPVVAAIGLIILAIGLIFFPDKIKVSLKDGFSIAFKGKHWHYGFQQKTENNASQKGGDDAF